MPIANNCNRGDLIMTRRAKLSCAALAFAACASGTLIASAATNIGGPDQSDAVLRAESAPLPKPFVLPFLNGHEQPLFSYELSRLTEGGIVKQASSTDDGVQLMISTDEVTFTPSCDRFTVMTGLCFGVVGQEDGSFLVFGVVPDQVDSVNLDGRDVDIRGDVWTVVVPDGSVRVLLVGDAKNDLWARLPADPG
jgi:hypothetical protein